VPRRCEDGVLRSLIHRLTLPIVLLLAASVAPASADEPTEPRSFTLAASGDILITETVRRVADANAPGTGVHDFYPMLASVEPWIASADLAICHIETPLLPSGSGIRRAPTSLPFPQFSGPDDLAPALASAGFDACSTAANHALDYGLAGLGATLDALDAAGLGHAGTARSAEEDHPTIYEINGVTVAHGAYTFGTNKIFVDEEWAVNYLDLDEMLADAAWARTQGAEFVFFSVHWGKDYTAMPSERQLEHARPLIESDDIDLIVGHHSHVVQPFEVINGKYVVYGMGNQLSSIRSYVGVAGPGSEDGIIAQFEITEQPDGSFAVTDFSSTPTRVLPDTMEVVPVEHSLAYSPRGREGELQRSLALTLDRLSLYGFEPATTATPWPIVSCRGQVATILGTEGDDLVVGTPGDDVIVTRGGDDAVWAGGGNDLICLGDGDDFANGGDGDDHIRAGDGDDLVLGGGGADTVWSGNGDDVASGLDGDDLLIGEGGGDSLLGGDGDDVLWGGVGNDRLIGNGGTDICRGAATIASCER
jgi:poly-gamma-glutamate capsule biosynthesis protein CapA/YwtB (metallophosphatase superfamily)